MLGSQTVAESKTPTHIYSGSGILMNSGGIKLVLCELCSPHIEMIQSHVLSTCE